MGTPSIKFFNENVNFNLAGKRKIKGWIIDVAEKEKKNIESLNIIFTDDKTLSEINIKYLKNNSLTDVIAFDYKENEMHITGDIFISIERVRENAKKFKVKVQYELRRVIIHGVLHLAGYKDKSPTEKAEMTKKEDYYLTLLS